MKTKPIIIIAFLLLLGVAGLWAWNIVQKDRAAQAELDRAAFMAALPSADWLSKHPDELARAQEKTERELLAREIAKEMKK